MADEFTLKYDSTDDQLVGEDPNGNEIPIPLDSLDVSGSASADSLDVSGSASIDGTIGTQTGVTELGNEVVPSGSIQTGPQTASTNAKRAVYQDAPVTADATQGTESLLTMLQSGATPAMYMERTIDGQGGAYGHQLQAPLGRFARINANLSWEYDTFSQVPHYVTGQQTGSGSFSLQSTFPRRIEVAHDGSGDNGVVGIKATPLVTADSLGAFSITFHDVAWSQNSTENHIRLGLTTANPGQDISSFDGIFYYQDLAEFRIRKGVENEITLINAVDWSSNHDVTITYDGGQGELFVDGVRKAGGEKSLSSPVAPILQQWDSANTTAGETLSVEQITVEPLSEVLQ